ISIQRLPLCFSRHSTTVLATAERIGEIIPHVAHPQETGENWIPACAGMTTSVLVRRRGGARDGMGEILRCSE
ncbi:MAG TPA: hypothetical protein PLT86_01160, partial [Candidatus Latescibacteria bacterium]|nr:hypothetical protein [Candidatus Latescibacterota bacterium]